MHRALSCLQARTATLTLAGPSPFARVLKAATSRAWLRRVSVSQTSTYASGAAYSFSYGALYESIENGRARGVSKSQTRTMQRHSSETELDHDLDRNLATSVTPTANQASADSLASGSRTVDQGIPLAYDTNALFGDHPEATVLKDPKPTLSENTKTSTILSLSSPTSPQMFYDNLRFASCSKPSPDVEALIGYHDSYPHLHSPETYNICIDFAIEHERFDAANRLFDSMTKGDIYFDNTTHQLLVRLHARQLSELGRETPDRPILRKGSTSVMQMLSVIRDSELEIETEEFLRRILACLRPMFSGWEVHPKIVKAALYSIVNRDLTSAATELTSTYFSLLPLEIDEEMKVECLDMIHLLLSTNTRGGLPSLFANKKLLITLLKTHPSFQPSSDTLFLLLSPLKRAKKCGTVALRIMESFQKTWGSRVVDERVRQRIMKFAEKEGRLDIIEKMRG